MSSGYIYVLREDSAPGIVKIGYSGVDWRRRIGRFIPCNPRSLKILRVFEFSNESEARTCESAFKSRVRPFPTAGTGGAEWYHADDRDIETCPIFARHGGHEIVATGLFKAIDSLNPGDKSQKHKGVSCKLLIYLLAENPDTGFCKIKATAYNWWAAETEYATGNPRSILVRARWAFPTNVAARQAVDRVVRRFASAAPQSGWLQAPAMDVATMIQELGGQPMPRDPSVDVFKDNQDPHDHAWRRIIRV